MKKALGCNLGVNHKPIRYKASISTLLTNNCDTVMMQVKDVLLPLEVRQHHLCVSSCVSL
jgi:hypothetical protein